MRILRNILAVFGGLSIIGGSALGIGMLNSNFRNNIYNSMGVVSKTEYNNVLDSNNQIIKELEQKENSLISLENKRQEMETKMIEIETQMDEIKVQFDMSIQDKEQLQSVYNSLLLEKTKLESSINDLDNQIVDLNNQIEQLKNNGNLYLTINEGPRKLWIHTEHSNSYIQENSSSNFIFDPEILNGDIVNIVVDQTNRTIDTNIDVSQFNHISVKKKNYDCQNATAKFEFVDEFDNVYDFSNIQDGTKIDYKNVILEDFDVIENTDSNGYYDYSFTSVKFKIILERKTLLKLGFDCPIDTEGELEESYMLMNLLDENDYPTMCNTMNFGWSISADYVKNNFKKLEILHYDRYSESGPVLANVEIIDISSLPVEYQFIIDDENCTDTFEQSYSMNWSIEPVLMSDSNGYSSITFIFRGNNI